MLEGTFRLLKWEAKLVWALLGLAFATVTATVRGATWLVRRVSRARPRRQGAGTAPIAENARPAASQDAATPVQAPPASAAPPGSEVNVNVTVNNHPPAPHASAPLARQAMPVPPESGPMPELASAPTTRPRLSPVEILGRPDHGIYLTTGSALMAPHPFADELLEQLDRMLLAAAYRHGRPWMLPPELDSSAPPSSAPSLALAPIDDGFDPCIRRLVPTIDNLPWVARAGRDYERAVGT